LHIDNNIKEHNAITTFYALASPGYVRYDEVQTFSICIND